MKKVLKSLLLVFVVVSFSLSSFFATPVFAQVASCSFSHQSFTYSSDLSIPADLHPGSTVVVNVSVDKNLIETNNITVNTLQLYLNNDPFYYHADPTSFQTVDNGYQATFLADAVNSGDFRAVLRGNRVGNSEEDLCFDFDALKVRNLATAEIPPGCQFTIDPQKVDLNTKSLTVSYDSSQLKDQSQYSFDFVNKSNLAGSYPSSSRFSRGEGVISLNISSFEPTLGFKMILWRPDYEGEKVCEVQFPYDPSSGQINPPQEGAAVVVFDLCRQAGANPNRADYESHPCVQCLENEGIWTAVGCIPYANATGMIRAFINLGLGIGGGVVVLMVLAGGFVLSTSQGDPKRVEEAKAMISSAVMGLVFVIFSITILRFIGVSVLQLPGFGS